MHLNVTTEGAPLFEFFATTKPKEQPKQQTKEPEKLKVVWAKPECVQIAHKPTPKKKQATSQAIKSKVKAAAKKRSSLK